jgi:hypothetical protein
MDENERLALVGIAGMSPAKKQGPSKVRILSPRICEEPRKPRVPGFLEGYESGEGNLRKEPAGGNHTLSGFVDAGVPGLRRVRAR